MNKINKVFALVSIALGVGVNTMFAIQIHATSGYHECFYYRNGFSKQTINCAKGFDQIGQLWFVELDDSRVIRAGEGGWMMDSKDCLKRSNGGEKICSNPSLR